MINFSENRDSKPENIKKNSEFESKPAYYQRKDPEFYEKESYNEKKDPFNYYKDYGNKESKGVPGRKAEDLGYRKEYLEENAGYGVQKNRFEMEKERENPTSNQNYKGGNPIVANKLESYEQKNKIPAGYAPKQQLSGYEKYISEERKKNDVNVNKPNPNDYKNPSNYPSNSNNSNNYNVPTTNYHNNASTALNNNYNNVKIIKPSNVNVMRPGEQYNKLKNEELTKKQETNIKGVSGNNLYSQQVNAPTRNAANLYNPYNNLKPAEKPASNSNPNKNLNLYEKKNSFDDRKPHMKDYNKEIPEKPGNYPYKPNVPSKNYEGKSAGVPVNVSL